MMMIVPRDFETLIIMILSFFVIIFIFKYQVYAIHF